MIKRLEQSLYAPPLTRGDWLREEVKKLEPKQTLELGDRDVDLGTGPGIHMPQYTTLVGQGGTIYSRWFYQLQNMIEMSHGVRLKDVRAIMDHPDPTYPGVCVGFCQAAWSKVHGGPVQHKGMQAEIDGGFFQGKEYGLYLWGAPDACKITARNRPTFCGKIGACLGTGNGPNAGYFDLYEPNIIGSMAIARTGGASGVGLAGLLIRGGVCNLWGGYVSSIAIEGTDASKNLKYQAAAWLGMADKTEAKDNLNRPTWAALAMYDVALSYQTIPGVECHYIREGISAWPGKKAEPGRLLAVNCTGDGKPITAADCFGEVDLKWSPPFPVGA